MLKALRLKVLPVLLTAPWTSWGLFLPLRPVRAAIPSSLFAPVIASRDYRRRRLVADRVLGKNNAMSSSSSTSSSGRRGIHGDSSQDKNNGGAAAGSKAVVNKVRGGLMVAPPLARTIQCMAGMNLLGFAVSVATQWHYHLDLIGTGAFVVSALASHAVAPAAVRWAPRQLLLTGLVATWGTRLAGFLFYRVLQCRHDARLDDLLRTATGAATFWGLSYVWGQLVILPQALALSPGKYAMGSAMRLGPGGVACAAVAAMGIACEATADFQKFAFKNDPANKGAFCDAGLWKWSQHPNYAGELLTWYGLFGLAAPALWQTSSGASGVLRYLPAPTKALAVAAVGPAFLTLLLCGQAGGSIGNAKELATAKWAGNAKYEAYQRDTPLIFPRLL